MDDGERIVAEALLDTDETAVACADAAPADHTPCMATPAEASFRHSGWADRREATIRALQACTVSPATMHRFQNCGAAAWVMQDKNDPSRLMVQAQKCRSRWCEACAREKRLLMQRNLQEQLPKTKLRFLTLTLKSSGVAPELQIQRLYDCFRRFRNRQDISERISGGIAFLEITYAPEREEWHPHLHILFSGKYLPHALARKHWLLVTGDSYIVDVREVKSNRYAAGYLTKYSSKAVGPSIWRDPAAFTALIVALRGRRTLFTFGTWKGIELLKPPPQDTDWQTLGKLENLLARSRAGDREAQQIVARLGFCTPVADDAVTLPDFDASD